MELVQVECVVCHRDTYKQRSHILKSNWVTCSKKCHSEKLKEINSADKNPNWKGGLVVREDGRRMIYVKDHPFAKNCGSHYILEYRLIAEKKLGRYLREDEIVHHINGDITDNSPENLDVTTQSNHARIHFYERKRSKKTGRLI